MATGAGRSRCGFNPCFSGCRPATSGQNRRWRDLKRVSILVLVDAALRHSGPVPCNFFRYVVSILVLVDAALRLKHRLLTLEDVLVSILVLVDAALRHPGVERRDRQDDVSILVLVDAALRPVYRSIGAPSIIKFQSLF